ncbi:MAG: hypothetical protein AVDCRST_MAG93-9274 [uncultured Chloroflexia bacterium]|uniref:Uncharacterized protein n=1 Tax=uncultured Chloroflexia bacterium TaxID=1672391 RepID=A0A6J4NE24_9CHLR|nr:MAG: hypothetical protein AVDCRST_MAG93-9274 [uncultured Chloroflexia bacterium]
MEGVDRRAISRRSRCQLTPLHSTAFDAPSSKTAGAIY